MKHNPIHTLDVSNISCSANNQNVANFENDLNA